MSLGDLCKYKDSLGKPGQGIHSYRVFNIAVVDFLATILAGFLISKIFKLNTILTIIILFLLGIILHKIFCVDSTINKYIFKD